MRITKSTPDAVIASLYPKGEEEKLLARFEDVKALANLNDGERDKLRQYIQDHITDGRYGNCILTIETSDTEQMYPNTDGRYALKFYTIVEGFKNNGNDGATVVVLNTGAKSADVLADQLLHQLQKGKEELVRWLSERVVAVGDVADNTALYSEKASKKINIIQLPEV